MWPTVSTRRAPGPRAEGPRTVPAAVAADRRSPRCRRPDHRLRQRPRQDSVPGRGHLRTGTSCRGGRLAILGPGPADHPITHQPARRTDVLTCQCCGSWREDVGNRRGVEMQERLTPPSRDGLTKRADQGSIVKVRPISRSGRHGRTPHDAPLPGQSSGLGLRDTIAPAQAQPLISGVAGRGSACGTSGHAELRAFEHA